MHPEESIRTVKPQEINSSGLKKALVALPMYAPERIQSPTVAYPQDDKTLLRQSRSF
jgi:hypothetical protein